MAGVLAIMVTMTTYGTWLRGDARGWVDKGIVLPPDPDLETADRERLKHPPFRFRREDWHRVGCWLGESVRGRLNLTIYAMTVQAWHVHVVVRVSSYPLGRVVKCAKDAVRWGLRAGRPIWGGGYDKRFCYDLESLQTRVAYVEQHNLDAGCPAKPWAFVETWESL
ncbi:MAG TPA: hypothetical protein VM431_04205 [Phycisphaerae bacterium]|nr:hypothetical protein [Phycisphaerae bacterium]